MRCWCIMSYTALPFLFLILGIHGQNTGLNVPSDPLWPLFAELLSSESGRTVQDINALGLNDPTISQMWTTYQSSMPKLDISMQPATSSSPDINIQPASGTGADITQQLLSMIGSMPTSGGTASSGTGMSSAQDMLTAYQNAMSSGGSGQTPTSTAPSYNDLMSQYQAIMGQGQTSTSSSSALSTSPTPSMNDIMNAYTQMMGGQSVSSPIASNTNQLLQTMGGQPTSSVSGSSSPSTSLMDQAMQALMSNYQTLMAGTTNTQSNTNRAQPTQVVVAPVDMVGSVSVDGSLTNKATSSQPQQSSSQSSSLSSFDQQLVQLFPQFKTVLQPSPSSSPSPPTAAVTTPTPPASISSSSNASDSQTTADISNTNSAQQIFDVLLFGQGGQTNNQTTGAPTSDNNKPPQSRVKSPLEHYMMEQQKKMTPGKLLYAHVENVWKTRASRYMGCRFLPELLELDIFPGVPLDCRNKCPFPLINPQQFGVYCMCCPPGINDQIVSTMSLLKRPAFLKDSPLKVMP